MQIQNNAIPVVKLYIEKKDSQFTASVKLSGNVITCSANKDADAINALEIKLAEMGAPKVKWKVEYKVVEASKIPNEDSFEGSVSKYEPPEMPKLDNGFVTPISDKEYWCSSYRKAIEVATRLMQNDSSEKFGEKVARFRNEVNSCMENVKGAIPCIGAYRSMPSGDKWIRLTDEKDPTTRQTNKGEGANRERHHRNINGNWENVSGESDYKKMTTSEGSYQYPGTREQKSLAYKLGKSMSAKAAQAGYDRDVQSLWYKLGFVVSLRSQRAPYHTQFESDLMVAGISEEKIRAYVKTIAGQYM
jgi:hypothetical protein